MYCSVEDFSRTSLGNESKVPPLKGRLLFAIFLILPKALSRLTSKQACRPCDDVLAGGPNRGTEVTGDEN